MHNNNNNNNNNEEIKDCECKIIFQHRYVFGLGSLGTIFFF